MNSMDPGRDAGIGLMKERHGIVTVTVEQHHPSLGLLDKSVVMVHVTGHLFVWGIEKILENAPNVKEIQVQPHMVKKLTDAHRTLCAKAGVKLTSGYSDPDRAWEKGEVRRSPRFLKIRKFFQLLEGQQKKLFDELIEYGIESALMARDYYEEASDGKEGEEPVTLHTLCKKYGYNDSVMAHISARIYSVLVYLDPNYKVGQDSRRLARVMKDDVERLREKFATAKARQDQAAALGLRILPVDMPLQLYDELEMVVTAQRKGWLKQLQAARPRAHRALTLRYDIRDTQNPRFRTLEEVAETMGGEDFKTRERARQLVEQAIEFFVLQGQASGETLRAGRVQEKATKIVQKKAARAKAGPVTQLTKVPGPVEKQVVNLVCQSYGLPETEIFTHGKDQPWAEARQVIMALWRRYLNWSYPLIAREMGKEDHTTIIHGCREIASRRKTDRVLEQRMTLIEMMLGKPPPDLSAIEISPDPSTASQ